MEVTRFDPPPRIDVRHLGRVVQGTGTFLVEPAPGGAWFVWVEDVELPSGWSGGSASRSSGPRSGCCSGAACAASPGSSSPARTWASELRRRPRRGRASVGRRRPPPRPASGSSPTPRPRPPGHRRVAPSARVDFGDLGGSIAGPGRRPRRRDAQPAPGRPRPPLHPMLVHFPIALYPTSLVFDVLSHLSEDGNPFVRGAFTLIVVALVVSVLAIAAGFADFLPIENGTRTWRVAVLHMSVQLVTGRPVPGQRRPARPRPGRDRDPDRPHHPQPGRAADPDPGRRPGRRAGLPPRPPGRARPGRGRGAPGRPTPTTARLASGLPGPRTGRPCSARMAAFSSGPAFQVGRAWRRARGPVTVIPPATQRRRPLDPPPCASGRRPAGRRWSPPGRRRSRGRSGRSPPRPSASSHRRTRRAWRTNSKRTTTRRSGSRSRRRNVYDQDHSTTSGSACSPSISVQRSAQPPMASSTPARSLPAGVGS